MCDEHMFAIMLMELRDTWDERNSKEKSNRTSNRDSVSVDCEPSIDILCWFPIAFAFSSLSSSVSRPARPRAHRKLCKSCDGDEEVHRHNSLDIPSFHAPPASVCMCARAKLVCAGSTPIRPRAHTSEPCPSRLLRTQCFPTFSF